MIKERGGFDKFDVSKPKFKLVDMDKLNKQGLGPQAVSDNESMNEESASIPADLGLSPNTNNNNDVFKRELMTASSTMDDDESTDPSNVTNNDDHFDVHGLRYNDNFGQDGPMMM